jgi:ferredoxin-NADP reductase
VSLLLSTASSPVLAFATTVHLALASLRNHRRPATGPVSSLAVISVLLAALPWLFPHAAGLLAGFAVHAIWFAVCERWAPPAMRPTPAPSSPAALAPISIPSDVTSRTKPRGFVQTPVLGVFDETSDVRTFRFARPEGFDFQPGQFVTIRVRADGVDLVRCYSISSAPHASGYLEISVKRQGQVSSALHATLSAGSTVWLGAPAGSFVYPHADDRPLLLLAGGIGITPLLSMIRHAVATEPTRPVVLLYAARTPEALAFRSELTALARRHPQVRLVMAVSSGLTSSDLYPGRIDEVLVRAVIPAVRDAVAMICGPQPMIDAMRTLLQSMGVPSNQIRFERFEAAVAAAAGRVGDAPKRDGVASAHQMRCSRSGKAVAVRVGQSILEAAEAAGVPIDSLCRAGVCGTCRTRVLEGDVDCESTTLDASDRQNGFVLACVSRVLTDCTVEA